MTRPEVPSAPSQAAEAAFEEHGTRRHLAGRAALVVAGAALAFSTFQLVIAAFSPLSSLPTRAIHVGFLIAIALLVHPVGRRADRSRIAWYDASVAAIAFGHALYHLVFESDLIARAGDPTTADLVVGTLFVLLLFDASRRVLGPALPIICGPRRLLAGNALRSGLGHGEWAVDGRPKC